MPSEEEVRPDAPFDAVSATTMSRGERYRVLIDQWVSAPLRILLTDWRSLIGLLILTGFVLVAVVGTRVVTPPFDRAAGPSLVGPFEQSAYPLGTDAMGNDLLGLLVFATPPMLKMILAGGVFSTIMATVIGSLSGYKGGLADRVLMTLNDVSLSIPGFALMIVLGFFLQPTNPYLIGFILTINAWAGLARSIRSQVLSLRQADYIEASQVMGLSTTTILSKDLLPNIMPYILVSFVNSARVVVFNSVALYFLGALPFETLNWGVVLNQAYNRGAMYTWSGAHWLLEPIAMLVLLSLSFVLLAQGFDRVFNPRVRARHSKTTDTVEEFT